ncbi:MAG: hypothetical protein EBV09_03160 [Actinobacteria bacterium]|nr:hypothetical protein [Actinomycetota bacterium]
MDRKEFQSRGVVVGDGVEVGSGAGPEFVEGIGEAAGVGSGVGEFSGFAAVDSEIFLPLLQINFPDFLTHVYS